MDILVLTQQGGILKPFAILLGYIMNYIYQFLEIFGIENVGLTIVLFTLVVNLLLMPLTFRQQKFTKLQKVMQPELNKIQKKYAGKRDEKSMRMQQAETQAVYDKYGASPASGCLPLLIQFPILFALYRVIYNVPAYVKPVKDVYLKIAEPIMNTSGAGDIMNDIISSMNLKVTDFDITNSNKVVDVLYLIKSTGWDTLKDAFSSSASVVDAINTYASQIVHMNSLPGGLNIADTPMTLGNGFWGIFPGILIPLLAGLTQFWSYKVTQKNAAQQSEEIANSSMGSSMKMMNYTMPLMSVFFCITLPTGIGVYWVAIATFRTIISIFIDKFSHIDAEELIEKNKEKAAEKAAKRQEQQKQLESYAQMRTSKISDRAKTVSYLDSKESTAGQNKGSAAQNKKSGSSSSRSNNNNNSRKNNNSNHSSAGGGTSSGSGKKTVTDSKQKNKKSISGYAHMINKRDE